MEKSLIYLGNENSKPICRDAEWRYAESVGLKFKSLKDWLAAPDLDQIPIVDCGWKTPEYMDYLEEFLNRYKNRNIWLRIVDDPNKFYDELDCRLYYLICHYNMNFRIISPYDHMYFNSFKTYVIPYHYDEDDEMKNTGDKFCILSGFDDPCYGIRHELYQNLEDVNYNLSFKNNNFITTLKHPGYSGRCWSEGKLGKDYIKALSEFKFMVVSTGYDFEILKYVECAEAGCCPIGEFPTSLLEIMPKELKVLHCTDRFTMVDLLKSDLDYKHLAKVYRDFMKSDRSLYSVVEKLNKIKIC